MRNFLDKFVEKIKTNILSPKTFFENRAVYERAGWTTDDSMAHAHCVLNT